MRLCMLDCSLLSENSFSSLLRGMFFLLHPPHALHSKQSGCFDCAWSLLNHGVAERRRCDLGKAAPERRRLN